MKTILAYAFNKCSKLEKVVLPAAVASSNGGKIQCDAFPDSVRELVFTSSVPGYENKNNGSLFISRKLNPNLKILVPEEYKDEYIAYFKKFNQYGTDINDGTLVRMVTDPADLHTNPGGFPWVHSNTTHWWKCEVGVCDATLYNDTATQKQKLVTESSFDEHRDWQATPPSGAIKAPDDGKTYEYCAVCGYYKGKSGTGDDPTTPSIEYNYGITGSVGTFGAKEDYDHNSIKQPINISNVNSGNWEDAVWGDLKNVSVSIKDGDPNQGNFEVKGDMLAELGKGKTDSTWYIKPSRNGLTPGTYNIVLAIKSDNITKDIPVTFTVSPWQSKIDADNITIDSAKEGVKPQSKPIVITNTNNGGQIKDDDWGALKNVTVSFAKPDDPNNKNFTLTGSEIGSITKGEGKNDKAWSITPNENLKPGTYTVDLLVTSKNGGTKTVTVTFTVTEWQSKLDADNVTFEPVKEGVTPQPKPIVITNTNDGGNIKDGDWGDLKNVTVSFTNPDDPNNNNFTLIKPDGVGENGIPSIEKGKDNSSWQIVPNKNLPPGEYKVKLTVKTENGGSKEIEVTLTVSPWQAKLDSPDINFTADKGYTKVEQPVTIKNIKDQINDEDWGDLKNIKVTLKDGKDDNFKIVGDTIGSLKKDGSDNTSWKIVPKPGLKPGVYTTTLVVTSENGGKKEIKVTFTVKDNNTSAQPTATPAQPTATPTPTQPGFANNTNPEPPSGNSSEPAPSAAPSASPAPRQSAAPQASPSAPASSAPRQSTAPQPSQNPAASTAPQSNATPSNAPIVPAGITNDTPTTPSNAPRADIPADTRKITSVTRQVTPNTPAIDPTAVPVPSKYEYPTYKGVMPDPNDPNSPEVIVVIDEDDIPLAYRKTKVDDGMMYIPDETIPLAPYVGSWALINLILTILTVVASAVLLLLYLGKKRREKDTPNRAYKLNEQEQPEEIKKKGALRLISVIVAVVSVIVFILTEDMRLPMEMVDKYTIWMAVIAIVQAIVCVFSKKKKKGAEKDERYRVQTAGN